MMSGIIVGLSTNVGKLRGPISTMKLFVELPPHLAYICLLNNDNFPSIVLSSLPERDKTLLVQILRRNGVEIKDGQDTLDITSLKVRELGASDFYKDTK